MSFQDNQPKVQIPELNKQIDKGFKLNICNILPTSTRRTNWQGMQLYKKSMPN